MQSIFKILKLANGLWKYYVAVIFFVVLVAVLGSVSPFVIKAVVDLISYAITSGENVVNQVLILAILLFAVESISSLFSNIGGYFGDIMKVKLTRELSNTYYKQLLSLPQEYFDKESTGRIINRLNRSINEVVGFIQMMSNNFFAMYLRLFISIGIIVYYSWYLGLFLALVYPVFLWITSRSSSDWQKIENVKNQHSDIASGRFAEVVSQLKVVKSFNSEENEKSIFDKHMRELVSLTYKQSRHWHKMDVYRRFALDVIYLVVFGFIFMETANSVYTIGDLAMMIQLVMFIKVPTSTISFVIDSMQRAIAGSKDYFKVLEYELDTPYNVGKKMNLGNKAKIEYRDVSFGYNADKKLLHGIDFTIEAGEKVALVSQSGQGKTTLTNLLLGYYPLNSGEILLNDQNIEDVSRVSLRDSISVVFQDPSLFSGTIEENIKYSNPNATDEEMHKAAKAANIHDYIIKLEKSYKTEIGERGAKISGGQKQRIAIARAILKDAPILILDEATSSLDNVSEKKVQQALDRLMKRRTTIIIAHRLSTISNADKIITLKNGTIDEIDTPDKLAVSGGIYQNLLNVSKDIDNKQNKKKLEKYDISTS